jgi:single-strand DNA-binding protein
MSKGINKVILIGNLGKDADTHYFYDGKMVTNLTVATSSSWKDKHTEAYTEKMEECGYVV